MAKSSKRLQKTEGSPTKRQLEGMLKILECNMGRRDKEF